MAKYVFSGAVCRCQLLESKAEGKLSVNNKITGEKHKGIITTDKKPDMFQTAMCNLLTNPAVATAGGTQKCVPMWVGNWINIEPCNVKVLRKTPLFSNAMLVCAYGGIVTITNPSCNKTYHKIQLSGLDLNKSAENVKKIINDSNMAPNAKEKAISGTESIFCSLAKNNENSDISESNDYNSQEIEENNGILTENPNSDKEKIEKPERLYNASEMGICSGNCPNGLETSCKYKKSVPESTIQLNPKNDSQTLKSHMKNSYNAYDQETNNMIENLKNDKSFRLKDKVTFRTEHHHLIPGDECFSKYKLLVDLANLYRYDINNPDNGIPLPSAVGSTLSDEERIETYVYIMNKTGRQIHRGNHGYLNTLKKYNLNKEKQQLNDYETIVNERLYIISQFYSEELSKSCRMQDSDEKRKQDAETFKDIMKYLSDEMRNGIMSNKYYVSAVSILYEDNKNSGNVNDITKSILGAKKK